MEATTQRIDNGGALALLVGILAAVLFAILLIHTQEHTKIVAPAATGVVQWSSDSTSWTGGWR